MYFQGVGQGKNLLCKGGSLHEKLDYRGVFCQLNLISKKSQMQKKTKKKKTQKCKKLSNIENIFLPRFDHSAFYKIHMSGAVNRHAPGQYAKYVFLFLFSKQSS